MKKTEISQMVEGIEASAILSGGKERSDAYKFGYTAAALAIFLIDLKQAAERKESDEEFGRYVRQMMQAKIDEYTAIGAAQEGAAL